jgi:4-amino-4-deoxy-L-arabinose transferase-like glycosyltransferase
MTSATSEHADAAAPPSSDQRALPELARAPVFSAMVSLAVVLTAFSDRYGYHRDELYFRMLKPAWGYVDEPPLTPILARVFTRVIADQPWALRIPATLATVASIFVVVLITREVGGGRRAQTLCAWAYAFASLPLVMGHVLLTASLDLLVWPLVLLLVIRAQARQEQRWWLVAGAVVGLSMYNKLLIAVLLVAIVAGLALVGPRSTFRSRWIVGAAALALVVGSPNIVYQATHHWPQLSMGRALADHNAGSVHIQMWPFLLLMLGPPLVPIWIAGTVSLLRRPEWRPLRFLAAALPVLLVLVFIMGSQIYYPFGLVAVLFAIGCVPTERWMAVSRPRRGVVTAGVALNAAVSLVIGLPLIPVSSLGNTPVPGINQIAQDSVGWPAYVREVAGVYATVPQAERAQTVIIASNYGEAGAVDRYGGGYGLPAVYSGQNQLYYEGRPPSSASVVVFVGGAFSRLRSQFASCAIVTHLDNLVGVDNEEQDEPVAICRGPIGGWLAAWPAFKHED